ncbi:MAG TPA: RNA 2',3'-cyclic phosphodiesterase [Syntrophobacteraceae bacterium]|nr:RNA 2',3'-cyclic phosphodiesterase [Syntrophobacteraceae bacterium]
MLRTFIAIDLPTAVQEVLERLEKEFQQAQAPVAWIKPERIHLTLKFLGDVAPERVSEIREGLKRVAEAASPFHLKPSGCGAFPSIKQMRVIWVGLQGDIAALNGLQHAVEESMAQLGFKKENRPFKPHLTLGRVKGRQHLRSLQESLLGRLDFDSEAFDVTELVLYKSELRPEGARYTPLFRKTFGQESPAGNS